MHHASPNVVKILEHNAMKIAHNRSSARFDFHKVALNAGQHSIYSAKGGNWPARANGGVSDGTRFEYTA